MYTMFISYGTFLGSEYCQCDSFEIRRLIDLADRRTNYKIRQRSHQATARMFPSAPRPNSPAGRERTQTAQRTRARRTLRGPNAPRRPVTSAPEQCAPGTYSNAGNGGCHFILCSRSEVPHSQTSFTLRTLVRTIPRRPIYIYYTQRTGVQSPDRAINIQNYNGA
jgi:hypothetical protein